MLRNSLMRKDKQPEIPTYNSTSSKETIFYISKLQVFKKSFLNAISCSICLFLFWFVIGQIVWSKHLYKGFVFACSTTILALLSFYIQSKVHFYNSNFSLIRLFARASVRKTKSKPPKSVRKKS